MRPGALRIEGELWLTLETVAECYRVEVTWVREVYARGLLGPGTDVEQTTAVAAAALDRMARVLRLHQLEGLHLEGIARRLEGLTFS